MRRTLPTKERYLASQPCKEYAVNVLRIKVMELGRKNICHPWGPKIFVESGGFIDGASCLIELKRCCREVKRDDSG